MGKKDKKKGKGAEKTAIKTEKKVSNKMKKQLMAIGEDNIENIIAQIEKEESERSQVKEIKIDAPTKRVNFTFLAHPDKEELILFGGEYFNGQKTFVYNDLFFYNIQHNSWKMIKSPRGPPPRCGHQMIVTSTNKGQLWLFGGEFASSTQSQFYHYKDLWIFHLPENRWEKLTIPNGPSPRSGHRMVYLKKQLFVFGGFHDNLRSYKYFNDIYSFSTDSYRWVKLEPKGNPPAPRSGCCMVPLIDGKILIYGGYSKENVKKDVDRGHIFSDAFLLIPDKNDTTNTKWRWIQTKLGGIRFQPRSGMSAAITTNNVAYMFGGVFDTEQEEEELTSTFYDQLFSLDLNVLTWKNVILKKEKAANAKRQKDFKASPDNVFFPSQPNTYIDMMYYMSISDTPEEYLGEENKVETEIVNTAVVSDDGVFTVTVGSATANGSKSELKNDVLLKKEYAVWPSPRINCGLTVKRGILYLYGGMYEDGDKQITTNDFYSLDLHKLDGWRVLINDDQIQEWMDSESDDDDDDDEEDEESSENDQDEEESQ